MAVGDAFKAAITKAGIDAARDSARELAKALQDAKAAADALKPPPTPSQAAANEVRRLAAEARAAEAAYNALAKAQARAEAAGGKAAFKALKNFSSGAKGPVSPWASGKPPPGGPVSPKMPGGAKGAAAAAGDAPGKAAESAFKTPKDLKYILKHAGVGKAAMGALGAAAGLELSKLALGYRGMAMLQAVTQRAGLQIRQLFAGVDPKPVVRAFDTLTNQIFNKAGPAGKALSSIFDHMFNGLFSSVEKAEPYIQAFFEGAIVGALKMETAYYELRLAALPLTDALADLIGPVDGIATAAAGGEIALYALGVAAAAAVAPFAPLLITITAVVKALEQFAKLQKEIKGAGGWGDAAKDIGRHFIEGTGKEGEEARLARGRAAYDQAENERRLKAKGAAGGDGSGAPTEAPGGAAASGASGQATGKAYADGLAKGVAAGAPAAAAAGGAAAQGVDTAARGALKIKSPSKVGEDTGEEYPAGFTRGVDKGAPDAQDAMVRAVTPKGGAGAGAASSAAFPPEALALLRQIEANTRPRSGAQRSGGWGEPVHTIASVLGVSAS